MDGCGIFLLIMLAGSLLAIPFAAKARQEHDARAQELRSRFSVARASGSTQEIMSSARDLIDEFKRAHPPGLSAVSEEIYTDILQLLNLHPKLKPFALEMGRLSYGSKRKDGKLTVYDEQAILNDINASM